MRKSQFLIMILLLFPLLLVSCKTIELVSHKTVKLTVTWNRNAEPDIYYYNLYQVHQGQYRQINKDRILHPTTTYSFRLGLPDDFEGPLCFVIAAVDSSENESDYSEMVCIDN
ncbi:MAG: hypothetical protein GTN76_13100 [Candidatus Aenigmarchaeota archaeon]|nr:hypothetical protein [Candidatus Aenigmarchaeota archaeon]